jgi:hypothetical protein
VAGKQRPLRAREEKGSLSGERPEPLLCESLCSVSLQPLCKSQLPAIGTPASLSSLLPGCYGAGRPARGYVTVPPQHSV